MRLLACVCVLASTAVARPQWTLTVLIPGGTLSSEAHWVHSGLQVGSIIVGKPQAAVWSGTPGSWVNLNPPGALYSEGRGAYGDRQIGVALFNGFFHGGVWNGTASSWVDLTPSTAQQSSVVAIHENKQVGDAFEVPRASLWFGNANSRIDLNPAGASHSTARGVDATRQAGSANFGGTDHAGTWSGSAASWDDIHPPGAAFSQAWGVDGSQVVGIAGFAGVTRAYLWVNDTPIELHPGTATLSHAYAVQRGRQVGYAIVRDVYRAKLWTGTRDSSFDLHSALPPGSTFSIAKSIWVDGNRIYVAGFGNTSGVTEALLWSCQTVAPSALTVVRGVVASGGLPSLLESDDGRMVLNPGIIFSTSENPIQLRLDSAAPSQSPNGFAFSVEASASFLGCNQTISLYNFQLGVYENVHSKILTATDDTVNVTLNVNPARFIQPGTLAIRALVSYRAVAPAFAHPWAARVDKVWWTFPL